MSVVNQDIVGETKTRGDSRRQPRRRWRTLQNRIERARQFRRAVSGAAAKLRPPGGSAPQGA